MDPRALTVNSAGVEERDGCCVVFANGSPLTTPAGNPVETTSRALAEALADELEADGIADVTVPSLYAFFSTQHDFIEPAPQQTVDALVELLAHDYLLHPDERLDVNEAEIAAWRPQIELWALVAGQEPPYAPPDGEPEISRTAYSAFRDMLAWFCPAQLTVVIHAANLLKSVTLGILLAREEIDAGAALNAAGATLRLTAGETQDELDQQDEREDAWRDVIARLLGYAAVAGSEQRAAGSG